MSGLSLDVGGQGHRSLIPAHLRRGPASPPPVARRTAPSADPAPASPGELALERVQQARLSGNRTEYMAAVGEYVKALRAAAPATTLSTVEPLPAAAIAEQLRAVQPHAAAAAPPLSPSLSPPAPPAPVREAWVSDARPRLGERHDGSRVLVLKGSESASVIETWTLPPSATDPLGRTYFDVNIHSDAHSFAFKGEDGRWRDVGGAELGRALPRLGWDGSSPVRLLACSAGRASEGVAQELAETLGVDVAAPTTTHWRRSRGGPNYVGELTLQGLDADGHATATWQPGEWRTFHPQEPWEANDVLLNPESLRVPFSEPVSVDPENPGAWQSAIINRRLGAAGGETP